MIITLAERGFISRVPGQARSIKLLLPMEELPELAGDTGVPMEITSLAKSYPLLNKWVTTHGAVEFGWDASGTSMVRVMVEDNLIWAGNRSYATLDALLQDAEVHIARWLEEAGE